MRVEVNTLLLSALVAVVVIGCTETPESSLASPLQPNLSDRVDSAVAQSVQAYLKTFKLRETDLAMGLSIPWAWGIHWGTAAATGAIGPGGHEVYRVNFFSDAGQNGVHTSYEYLELAPDAAQSATPANR